MYMYMYMCVISVHYVHVGASIHNMQYTVFHPRTHAVFIAHCSVMGERAWWNGERSEV